jgi:hypothetical protein
MSDTPKFEVIDRRKYKAEEEAASPAPAPEPARETEPAKAPEPPGAGPRLVQPGPEGETEAAGLEDELIDVPPAPSAEESKEQKTAYDASAERMEDLLRAQNPGMGAPPPITFDALVQQFYYTAMLQLGAGTQAGQPARIDVIGARQSIDVLGILAEKTKGNLTDAEERTLEALLYEARMAFLEVTRMITIQGVQAPVPPKSKK